MMNFDCRTRLLPADLIPKKRSTERDNPYLVGIPVAGRVMEFKTNRRVHLRRLMNTDVSALLRPEGFDDPRLSEGHEPFFGQLGSSLA